MSSTHLRKPLEQLRDVLRHEHYALSTERVKRYILFHHKRHPQEMTRPEIEAFLIHLAVTENMAASTQNQAFNTLLFLYQNVLNIDIQDVNALRAKKPNANRDWGRRYVFPARTLSKDPRSDTIRRHYANEIGLQKAIKQATAQAGLTKIDIKPIDRGSPTADRRITGVLGEVRRPTAGSLPSGGVEIWVKSRICSLAKQLFMKGDKQI